MSSMDRGQGSQRGISRLSRLPLARGASGPASIHQDDPMKQSQLPRASPFHTKKPSVVRPLGEGGNATIKPSFARNTGRLLDETMSPIRERSIQEPSNSLDTTPPNTRPDCAIASHDDENVMASKHEFIKPEKRRPRLSLSERTIETLASIPSSPSPTRRRSSTVKSSGSMGPPSRPASAMRNHRADTPSTPSSGYAPSPAKRPFRPPGKPATLAKEQPTVNTLGPVYTPPRAHLRDQSSRIGKPLRDNRRSISTAITVNQGEKHMHARKPSSQAGRVKSMYDLRAAASHTLNSKPSLPTLVKNPATPKNESNITRKPSFRETSPQTSLLKARRPGENVLASAVKPTKAPIKPLKYTKPTKPAPTPNESRKREPSADALNKSSAALRDTIAKAKAARRAELRSSSTTTDNIGAEWSPDDIIPLESFTSIGSQSLQKKIDGAFTSGVLNLSALGLKSLPQEVLTMYNFKEDSVIVWSETVDLKKLLIADNELQVLPEAAFPDWSREELLEDPEKSNQFGGLEVLDLHHNNLIDLPVGIRRLEQLRSLNLSSNSLNTSVFTTICQLSSLRELRLAKNGLSGSIPPEIVNVQSLQVLDLRDNQLDKLPAGLSELQNLQKLLLGGNRISSVPFTSIPTQSLLELDLSRNLLTGTFVTPSDMTSLQKLQVLDLSNNTLDCVCSESIELPSLQTLVVHNNRLKSLPDLTPCVELTTLTVSDNALNALPVGFCSLRRLRNADLSGNDIKSLESELMEMESLTAFNIAGNPLREKRYLSMNIDEIKGDLVKKTMPIDAVMTEKSISNNDRSQDTSSDAAADNTYRPKAGILDISSRGLSSLEPSQIDLSTPIHTIRLANNDFTKFPMEVLLHPSVKWSLKSLDMSHNQSLHPVDYLDREVDLPILQSLYVVSTGLTTLDTLTMYLKAPELKELNISCHRMTGHIPWVRAWYPSITTLLASDNWFESIDVEAVRGLEVLDVRNNEIESLPPRIGLLGNHTNKNEPGKLRSFECTGNRLRIPRILVIEKGTEAILKDLRRMIAIADVPEEWVNEI
ncbi:hypothetical protein H2198_007941 [Neophaeococcomyces mojaviensis]|uniref:Uncharacterized protein n=1 Tax=Neophaeococcomyces mojaviensis TaxID=3383035 RepID=A0ACC2ZYP2_9EURO|nr:hypothetical protein H2198_007941 [Knufia sp. JES_112]